MNKLQSLLLAIKQWGPFALRTVGYGSVSIALGPLTKDRKASLWAMRKWCQESATKLGLTVTIKGIENVPQGAFVYCSNHQSLVDILVLGAVLPGDFKWAAKRAVMHVPFLGWHLRIAGHIPVDRGKGSNAANTVIDRFVQTLSQGKPVLVFPEGTRTRDGQLRAFKPGAFIAAQRAGVPVVPVALHGTFDLMKRGAGWMNDTGVSKTVQVVVGEAIYPPRDVNERVAVEELSEKTRASITKLLGVMAQEEVSTVSASDTSSSYS